jgi:CheY-like chemotaxis protein
MKISRPENLVLEIAGIGLWKWEPTTDVVSIDRLACEMCGLGVDDQLTLTMLGERAPAEEFHRFESALHRSLIAAEVPEVSLQCRFTVNGAERWFAFRTGRWPAGSVSDSSCRCLVGTVQDITDFKQREHSLENVNRDLDQRLHAQHAAAIENRHDLRNALASLQSAVRLFNKAELPLEVRTAACMGLQVQIDRIVLITNQLMSAAWHVEPGPPNLATAATTTDEQVHSTTFGQRIRPKRVLVADDNADAASTLATLLRLEGHDVLVAHDGQQAVEMAEQSHPEFLLLDLGMPDKDGLAVAREIKERSWARNSTLIAISGHDLREDRERTLEAGFNQHLAKPLDVDALNRLLAGP